MNVPPLALILADTIRHQSLDNTIGTTVEVMRELNDEKKPYSPVFESAFQHVLSQGDLNDTILSNLFECREIVESNFVGLRPDDGSEYAYATHHLIAWPIYLHRQEGGEPCSVTLPDGFRGAFEDKLKGLGLLGNTDAFLPFSSLMTEQALDVPVDQLRQWLKEGVSTFKSQGPNLPFSPTSLPSSEEHSVQLRFLVGILRSPAGTLLNDDLTDLEEGGARDEVESLRADALLDASEWLYSFLTDHEPTLQISFMDPPARLTAACRYAISMRNTAMLMGHLADNDIPYHTQIDFWSALQTDQSTKATVNIDFKHEDQTQSLSYPLRQTLALPFDIEDHVDTFFKLLQIEHQQAELADQDEEDTAPLPDTKPDYLH